MYFYRVAADYPKDWGIYGRHVVHGHLAHSASDEHVVQLCRTGPYMPPFTLPDSNTPIVTESFRRAMEASPLMPLTFSPVSKQHIVLDRWESHIHQFSPPIPADFSGSLDNIISERPHSSEVAEQLGVLWTISLPTIEIAHKVPRSDLPWDYDVHVNELGWTGSHLFVAKNPSSKAYGWLIADEVAKAWLEPRSSNTVEFRPCVSD